MTGGGEPTGPAPTLYRVVNLPSPPPPAPPVFVFLFVSPVFEFVFVSPAFIGEQQQHQRCIGSLTPHPIPAPLATLLFDYLDVMWIEMLVFTTKTKN